MMLNPNGDVGKFLAHEGNAAQHTAPHGAIMPSTRPIGTAVLTPVQGFQPYKADNLPPAHPDTAHHFQKFNPLGDAAVDTA